MIRPWSKPMYRAGSSRDPAGQPRARRLRGQDHRPRRIPSITGPARVFDSENAVHGGDHGEEDQAGRRDRHPLRRARRAGPGMQEMLAPTSALIGQGLGESVGPASPTGASPAAPGAWWSATSRRRPTSAAPSRSSRKAHPDHDRRAPASCSSLPTSQPTTRHGGAARGSGVGPPAPRYTHGVRQRTCMRLVFDRRAGRRGDGQRLSEARRRQQAETCR